MLKKVSIYLIALILLASAAFVVWGSTPLGPSPEALITLRSDERVQVEENDWLVFHPAGSTPDTGLIFYPGGRVDYRSYAPAARQIAQSGYLVVVARMPLNLAVLDSTAAERIIAAWPQIQNWAIGGHSLGGAMAARYAYAHPGRVQGLLLWAAYPASTDDLSLSDLRVSSVYGSRDLVASQETITAAKALLPANTTWVEIQGGNHAQFGSYGPQPGDGMPSIDAEQQLDLAVSAALDLLKTLE